MTRFTESDNARLERERFFKGHGRGTIAPEQQRPQVGFKRLSPDAVIPTKAHPTDSGFDLVASADVIIEPGATVVVPTGISVSLPQGYEASVRPRSGITSRTKIRVAYGTVDFGYSGEVGIIADNIFRETSLAHHNRTYFADGSSEINVNSSDVNGTHIIRKGVKLAQLVITRLPDVEAVEVFDVEESERGENGFGSSGVNV